MPRQQPGTSPQTVPEFALERGLPIAETEERYVLGAILSAGETHLDSVLNLLEPADLGLEKHRRILQAMVDLRLAGAYIDRVTLAQHLQGKGQLQSIDGLTYLASLDKDMPEVLPQSITAWARTIRDKADLRKLLFAAQRISAKALTGGVTAEEIHAEAIAELAKFTRWDSDSDGKSPDRILEQYPGGVTAFLQPDLRESGLPTGYPSLDETLGGGLQPGELYIIAARPRVGKSALLLNLAQNIAVQRDHRVDLFSLEMSAPSLLRRLLYGVSRMDKFKAHSRYLDQDDRAHVQRSLESIRESPIRIHEDFKKTLPMLIARIRKAVKDGSRMIGIDYAQLLSSGGRVENRNLELSEIARTLKLLTLELSVPLVLLSQIGRSAEKRAGTTGRPQLSDLKDSGGLEESADVVISIYREELHNRRDDNRGTAELDILKNRNGEMRSLGFVFLGPTFRFEERAKDSGPIV